MREPQQRWMAPMMGVNSIRFVGIVFHDIMLLAGGDERLLNGRVCIAYSCSMVDSPVPHSFSLRILKWINYPTASWSSRGLLIPFSLCSIRFLQQYPRLCGMGVAVGKAPGTKRWCDLIKKQVEYLHRLLCYISFENPQLPSWPQVLKVS